MKTIRPPRLALRKQFGRYIQVVRPSNPPVQDRFYLDTNQLFYYLCYCVDYIEGETDWLSQLS